MNSKKIALTTGLLMLVLGMTTLAAPPSYNGLHYTGFVTVSSTNTSMYGTMNVRFNPGGGHNNSYLYGNHSANSTVYFGGRDANNNRFFTCSVAPGTALYGQAVDIANNLTDGAYLYVTKSSSNSACTNVFLGKYSYYQH